MSRYRFKETPLQGLYIIQPAIMGDLRGYFMETYTRKDFEDAGLQMQFVQDNESRSTQGVLRGLHFQYRHPQGKLVRVTQGRVFDVAVDIRVNSSTFGKWFGLELSAENKLQFYIPEGFAHGFLVLSEYANVIYKCSDYYYPDDEGGIMWDDSGIGIEWPLQEIGRILLSDKDQGWGNLNNIRDGMNDSSGVNP